MSDETKEDVKETEKETRPEKGDGKRIVAFEILAEGFRIIRNDCVSALEFRGLVDQASEMYKKK